VKNSRLLALVVACLAIAAGMMFPITSQKALIHSTETAMSVANDVVSRHSRDEKLGIGGGCDSLQSCYKADRHVKHLVNQVKMWRPNIRDSYRPAKTQMINEFLCQAHFGPPAEKGKTCLSEHWNTEEYLQ
jgi:hypothetical protein